MDDLKHKLLYTTLELQKMKMKADVTLRKHKDTVQYLLNLLANAYKERDGARDQLHKLIYKSMSSRSPDQILAQVQPESPILNMYPKANLSKSKSNSEAYSHLLHCSSSVDSFDAAATPDFPNKNMVGVIESAFCSRTAQGVKIHWFNLCLLSNFNSPRYDFHSKFQKSK